MKGCLCVFSPPNCYFEKIKKGCEAAGSSKSEADKEKRIRSTDGERRGKMGN